MHSVKQAQTALEKAKQRLHRAVQDARSSGYTWAEIGETLGISRQAAFKRFGQVTDPVSGQKIKGVSVSLETLNETTEKIFNLISAGDYAGLEGLIHPGERKELSQEAISEVWNTTLSEVGALESYQDTHVVLPAGDRIEEDGKVLGTTVIGVTTLKHEVGEMMGRVAFDEQMRIVGLVIVTPEYSPLPF